MSLISTPLMIWKVTAMSKCSFGDGVEMSIGGLIDIDPCVYEDIEAYRNVTVVISRCKNCGNVEIHWVRQDDTEEIPVEEVE